MRLDFPHVFIGCPKCGMILAAGMLKEHTPEQCEEWAENRRRLIAEKAVDDAWERNR